MLLTLLLPNLGMGVSPATTAGPIDALDASVSDWTLTTSATDWTLTGAHNDWTLTAEVE